MSNSSNSKKPKKACPVLLNPLETTWPRVPRAKSESLVCHFKEVLERLGFVRTRSGQSKFLKRKSKRSSAVDQSLSKLDSRKLDQSEPSGPAQLIKKGDEKDRVTDTSGTKSEAVMETITENLYRKDVIFGVNAVTRALERDALRLLVVSSDARPPILLAHLKPLAEFKGCPALSLTDLGTSLGSALGLSSLTCMGVKKSDAPHPLDEIVASAHCLYEDVTQSVAAAPEEKNRTLPSVEFKTGDAGLDKTVTDVKERPSDTAGEEEKSLDPTMLGVVPPSSDMRQHVEAKGQLQFGPYSHLYVLKKDRKRRKAEQTSVGFLSLSTKSDSEEDVSYGSNSLSIPKLIPTSVKKLKVNPSKGRKKKQKSV